MISEEEFLAHTFIGFREKNRVHESLSNTFNAIIKSET
jgi:hypothetical protein